MAKVVILIGPDGLGKTPLGLMMGQKEGVEYVQIDAAKDPRKLTRAQIVENAFLEMDKWRHDTRNITLVYDRFSWPDDWIYQEISGQDIAAVRPVYQTPSDIHRMLEKRMQDLNNVGYLLIMPTNYFEYMSVVEDELVSRPMMHHVIDRYCWFYRNTKVPTIMVNNAWWEQKDAYILLEDVLDAIERKRIRTT